MQSYYKRPWDEDRGDDHADWGTSVWFFEVGEDGYPTRQLEVYKCGISTRYDAGHLDDDFGGLSSVALDSSEFAPFAISATEFEEAWASHRPHNQPQ